MLLTLIIFLPLLGAAAIFAGDREGHDRIRGIALGTTVIVLVLTIVAVGQFYAADGPTGGYRLTLEADWLGTGPGAAVDVRYRVGVDGVSLWLLVLTSLLMPLSVWGSFTAIRERVREYYALMLILQVGMTGVFCAMDLLVFYVFFEFTLVPLFFLIGLWGGPERQRAAGKFFIYTLAGSLLTFAAVLYLGYYAYAHGGDGVFTLDIRKLAAMGREGLIPAEVQWWAFLGLAAGFAIKVPLFPFHTWLPLAHTEAPTAGSVLLAGVLLKLGTYGFCRISLPILPEGTAAFAPLMATLAVIGILYGALAAWVQDDVKKLVAYSSVSHLGFCMLGMFSLKVIGVTGAVVYMVNHGLSTGALFLIVGMIYERYHTRDVSQIGGLARPMPWMAFFLIVFTLSSIGLPGLNGFVGEAMTLIGAALSPTTRDGLPAGPLGYGYVIPAAAGIILGAVYMLWMCQRVLFGPVVEPPHTPDASTGLTRDLTRREIGILAPIAVCCLVIGVYPKPMIETINASVVASILHRDSGTAVADDEGAAPMSGIAHSRDLSAASYSMIASPGGHGAYDEP